MMRHFVSIAALVAAMFPAMFPAGRVSAALRSAIIPETTAVRYGLTRPWFTQIQLDRGRARVRHVVLHEGTLYVQTNRAMVHAIDAETGETLWAKQVGRPNHPSMTPGLSRDLLAIINGSRLYVCNRYNGDLLYEVQVDGAPGAGAAVSKKRAYVPMVNGMVMAYRLEPLTDPLAELGKIKKDPTEKQIAAADETRREDLRLRQEYIPPLACRSLGKALVQPLVTSQTAGEEFVVWPTDRGYLNIGRIDLRQEDRFAIKYRLETDAEIAARPTYLPPDPKNPAESGVIYGASRDGFVHAIEERSGESLWRFSTGEPILQPAVVIDQRVYVATQPGGMYCLDASRDVQLDPQKGRELWWAPQIRQFVAASKQRVYAADRLGRILILNAKTGARLDTIPATALTIKLINSETDRLYLATDTGLIQCLHEVELSEPIRHAAARQKAAAGQRPAIRLEDQPLEAEQEPGAQEPGAGEDPFEPAADPLAPGGDDGGANDGAGGDGGADEDPFADDDPFS